MLANVIAFNRGPGVFIGGATDDDEANSVGNSIRANSIFGNGTIGIDLVGTLPGLDDIGDLLQDSAGDGVTPNGSDPATIANNAQDYPVLSGAIAGSITSIAGTVHSAADTTLQLDFYASGQPNLSAPTKPPRKSTGLAPHTSLTTSRPLRQPIRWACARGRRTSARSRSPRASTATWHSPPTSLPATWPGSGSRPRPPISTGDTSEFSLDLLVAPTVTTVTSSANPSFFGQSVTFTATVCSHHVRRRHTDQAAWSSSIPPRALIWAPSHSSMAAPR